MKLLFQGSSTTDVGRDRQSTSYPECLGYGWVQLLGSKLMCDNPKVEIVNRGIAGNRICDLYARWIEDTLNIDFDVLTILNGINDVGFGIRLNKGADAEKFRFVFDRMLWEVRAAKPKSSLVLVEPFLLKMNREEVPGNEDIVDNWGLWDGELRVRRTIVKELAEKFDAVFVPIGEVFDELCKTTPASHWSVDGIHLTSAGNEMLARSWMKYAGHLLKKDK